MKIWAIIILVLFLALVIAPTAAAQQSSVRGEVPKYNAATEAVFNGTVEEVTDRVCPVSGGMGSHLVLKLGNGKTIEVHLATSEFVKTYEMVFAKGDVLEVTGSKVRFEGVDTIFAREVKRGNNIFVFRDKNGKPAW
jgi:DNA/RNA endonuclease YhcR with UshA esterase domain